MARVEPFEFEFNRYSTEPTRCRVIELDYQRNGVGGEGFFVLRFQCSEAPERPLLGVVFETPAVCSVIDPSDLASHWRGDAFEPGLRRAIVARQDQIWAAA